MPPKNFPKKKPARRPAVKPSSADEQNQATVEDLEREGLGVAAKE